MIYSRYCRSILFTCGLQPHRFSKAMATGADICLVDCEDSVPPSGKAQARLYAADFFPPAGRRTVRLAVRINAVADPDGLADLLAIRSWPHRPDVVMVPKVESSRDIEIVRAVLGPRSDGVELMAIIETARGVQNVAETARAPGLTALVFGSADYSMSINSTMEWEPLFAARTQIVLAARAAGIDAVDTPTFDIDDATGLAADADRARNLGFSGKAAIHPRQVPVINEAFSPDAAALERARRIVAGAEANAENICVVDGMMVGTPIIEAARRTLRDFATAASASTAATATSADRS